MNNNLSIFNSLIVPDEEPEVTEQLTIEGMHQVTDSNSDNKDTKKTGKVVKYTAKTGKSKNSKVDINWDIKQYRLSYIRSYNVHVFLHLDRKSWTYETCILKRHQGFQIPLTLQM